MKGIKSISSLRRTLVADDFVHLLIPAMLSVMVDYILELADSIIAGNMLGDKALAGVTLCQPFFSFFLFVQVLILTGTAVLYSESVGREDRKAANKFFGQGVILSLAAGAFITLLSLIFKHQILNFLNAPKDIEVYAGTYFSYLLYLPLFIVYFVMYTVVMNDGGKKWCNISSIVLIVFKIVLSIVLCKSMGIGGLCLGTYIGLTVGILILMLKFFERNNKLKFIFFINLRESLNVMKFGFSESFFSLCVSGIYMFFNWFLLKNYDGNAIIIFTMVMSLLQLCVSVSDGINEAVQPIIEIFRGEGNLGEMAKTMSVAFYISSLFLVPVVVIIFIGAKYVPSIFGVNDPSLQTAAVEAIRIFMSSALFLIGGLCFCTYMLFTEHFVYSILNTLFVILMLPFTFLFGTSGNLNGVWAAMSISVVVGLFIILLLVRVRAKKYNCVFPWLIDKEQLSNQTSFDVMATENNLKPLMNSVEQELIKRGVEQRRILRILLMLEETYMLNLDKARMKTGKKAEKKFYVGCTLMFRDKIIYMFVRSNGAYSDVTNSDIMPQSLREYLSTMIVSSQKGSRFSLSVGDNRTIYEF